MVWICPDDSVVPSTDEVGYKMVIIAKLSFSTFGSIAYSPLLQHNPLLITVESCLQQIFGPLQYCEQNLNKLLLEQLLFT